MKLKEVGIALFIGVSVIAVIVSASIMHKYFKDEKAAQRQMQGYDDDNPKVSVVEKDDKELTGEHRTNGFKGSRDSDFLVDLEVQSENDDDEYDDDDESRGGNQQYEPDDEPERTPEEVEANKERMRRIEGALSGGTTTKLKKSNIERFNKEINFDKLDKINHDMFGWVRNDDFIDYPVLSSDDSQKYLTTTFDGKSNPAGAIFTLSATAATDDNISLYGHTMSRARTDFFASLHKYKDDAYRQKHKDFQFVTPYGAREYEVFAMFEMDIANDDFNPFTANFHNTAEHKDFHTTIVNKSMIPDKYGYSENNNYLTLMTCLYGGRDITDRYIVVAIEKR